MSVITESIPTEGYLRKRKLEEFNFESLEYQRNAPWPTFRGPNRNHTGLSNYKGPVTGGMGWIRPTSGSISSSPVVGSDGTVYIGSQDLLFYAISQTGTLKWSHKTNGGITSSACLGSDGNVYFGSGDFNIYAFNTTGHSQWVLKTANAVTVSPVVGSSGVIYAASGNILYSLSSSDGSMIWSNTYTLSSTVAFFSRSSPVVSSTGIIYIGTNANGMLAIQDLNSTSTLLWNYSTQAIFSSPALGNNNVIYFGCNDNNLYALDSITGNKLWSFATGGPVQSSPAIASDGTIYFGSNDNLLYSISSSGSYLWSFTTTADITSSPAIDVDGIIYFGAFDGSLYALMPADGSKKWVYTTSGKSNIASSPAIGLNHTLYFGTNGNQIIAINSSPPQSSSNRLSNVDIALIVVFSIFGFCICLVCCLSCLLWKAVKVYGIGQGDSVVGSLGALFLSSNISSRPQNNGNMEGPFNVDDVIIPQISWYDIKVDEVDNIEALVVGKGSFGIVYRAILEVSDEVTKVKSVHDIAVKVMTQSLKTIGSSNTPKDIELLDIAKFEAAVVIAAESRMVIKESIIKVYGIAQGYVPPHLSKPLEMSTNCSAIGIIMRSENGGSLQNLLHSNVENKPLLLMSEKLRLLTELAKGIADMHAAGIIHGDLKPDNVLLSADIPCKVRLADFGLAILRRHNTLTESTLQKTSATRGTPVYCAPEMFVNPYAQVLEDKVAKASRKTDMYAFALIAWEVLTQKKPFGDTTKEMLLVAQIYSGTRPSIEDIPPECPRDVVDMIVQTWDIDRLNRRTAIECFNLLQFEYSALSKQGFDVYISYEDSVFHVAKYIFYRLTQTGCVVCLIPVARRKDITDELQRSSVVVALLSEKFQTTPSCMMELSEARNSKPPKKIHPVLLRSDYEEWSDMQLQYLCQLKSSATEKFDLSLMMSTFDHTASQSDDGNDFITDSDAAAEVDRLVLKFSKSARHVSDADMQANLVGLSLKQVNSSNNDDDDDGNGSDSGEGNSNNIHYPFTKKKTSPTATTYPLDISRGMSDISSTSVSDGASITATATPEKNIRQNVVIESDTINNNNDDSKSSSLIGIEPQTAAYDSSSNNNSSSSSNNNNNNSSSNINEFNYI